MIATPRRWIGCMSSRLWLRFPLLFCAWRWWWMMDACWADFEPFWIGWAVRRQRACWIWMSREGWECCPFGRSTNDPSSLSTKPCLSAPWTEWAAARQTWHFPSAPHAAKCRVWVAVWSGQSFELLNLKSWNDYANLIIAATQTNKLSLISILLSRLHQIHTA